MVKYTDDQKSAIDKWNKANRDKKPYNKHWNALLVDELNKNVFEPQKVALLNAPNKQQVIDAERALRRKTGTATEVSSMSPTKADKGKAAAANSSKRDFTVSMDMSGIVEGMESTIKASMRAMVR